MYVNITANKLRQWDVEWDDSWNCILLVATATVLFLLYFSFLLLFVSVFVVVVVVVVVLFFLGGSVSGKWGPGGWHIREKWIQMWILLGMSSYEK